MVGVRFVRIEREADMPKAIQLLAATGSVVVLPVHGGDHAIAAAGERFEHLNVRLIVECVGLGSQQEDRRAGLIERVQRQIVARDFDAFRERQGVVEKLRSIGIGAQAGEFGINLAGGELQAEEADKAIGEGGREENEEEWWGML